jgi:FAD synthetase
MAKENKKTVTVMVFGTFDGIHDGHRHFLREAKKLGDKLVVAVAKDNTVKILKGHFPETPLPNRIMNLKQENIADEIISGDQEIKKWQVIEKVKPDTICIGYDQQDLKNALEKAKEMLNLNFKIETATPFKGDVMHSSLLKKR